MGRQRRNEVEKIDFFADSVEFLEAERSIEFALKVCKTKKNFKKKKKKKNDFLLHLRGSIDEYSHFIYTAYEHYIKWSTCM